MSILASANIKNAVRKEYAEKTDFAGKYADIWSIESNGGRKNDTRTAQQIIDDTTKAMGIKVIRGGKK